MWSKGTVLRLVQIHNIVENNSELILQPSAPESWEPRPVSPCLVALCGAMGRTMQGLKHARHVILPTEWCPDTCVFRVRNHRLKHYLHQVYKAGVSPPRPLRRPFGQLSPFYGWVGGLPLLAYKLGCYCPDSGGQGCEVGCEQSGPVVPGDKPNLPL